MLKRGAERPTYLKAEPCAIRPTAGAMWGRSDPMLDVIVLALGLVSFVLSIAYAYACDQL
jgi:hypothetical protein